MRSSEPPFLPGDVVLTDYWTGYQARRLPRMVEGVEQDARTGRWFVRVSGLLAEATWFRCANCEQLGGCSCRAS